MVGQQWEYCQLWLTESKFTQTGEVLTTKRELWSYNCYINYNCPNGDQIFRNLADLDKFLPFNPFAKAIGLLGAAAWELVSIQHALSTFMGDRRGEINWDNCVAYFKRPSIPGRAVDEPRLSI